MAVLRGEVFVDDASLSEAGTSRSGEDDALKVGFPSPATPRRAPRAAWRSSPTGPPDLVDTTLEPRANFPCWWRPWPVLAREWSQILVSVLVSVPGPGGPSRSPAPPRARRARPSRGVEREIEERGVLGDARGARRLRQDDVARAGRPSAAAPAPACARRAPATAATTGWLQPRARG